MKLKKLKKGKKKAYKSRYQAGGQMQLMPSLKAKHIPVSKIGKTLRKLNIGKPLSAEKDRQEFLKDFEAIIGISS